MRVAALCLALVAPLASSASGPAYFCAADQATGFTFNGATKQWGTAQLQPNLKLVISRSTMPGYVWEAKEVGSSTADMFCEQDFSSGDLLHCKGFFKELRFNKKLMRFLYSYSSGYWDEGVLGDFLK